jgi:hypothetical protein
MRKSLKYFSLLFFGTILLSSCTKNNPDPSWISISNWTLVENPSLGTEKELTQNFTDVYITVDDKIIGIFELPVKLPLLESGSHKITLYPVVLNNGISATKKIYPFCDKYEIYINLEENLTSEIYPTTRYTSGAKFWIEDFEDATLKISNESISKTSLLRKTDPAILKYGNAYGHVHLTTTDSLWYGITSTNTSLPKSGAEVYLEIDYMNTNSLLTGVLAYDVNGFQDNPNIQLNPQNASTMVWKKMYIELKEIVSSSVSAFKFEQYFKAIIDADKTSSDIYIDNIKIVHF